MIFFQEQGSQAGIVGGIGALTFACVAVVAALVPFSAKGQSASSDPVRSFEAGLRPAVSIAGEPEMRWQLHERMAHWNVPGISIAVIRDGKLAWARGYGVLQAKRSDPVDTETMFSVGSISKVGAAAMTLRLVDAGRVDLDRDVAVYLKRWKIPYNTYVAARPVTLRGILSHTAGFTVHGFADFQPGAHLPSVLDTLEGRPPARHEPVRVAAVPGERFRYSGGGTTVEQLLIEDVTGLGFEEAARRLLFDPLSMSRSTYSNPVPRSYGNVAKAHGPDGAPRALPRGFEAMPEMAASGLWSTPGDYAKLIMALLKAYRGGPDGFLRSATVRDMMTEVGPGSVGLGPFLGGEGADRYFYHAGANDSYRAWVEAHLETGNGVVIFTNGTDGHRLYAEVRRAIAFAEGWSDALRYHVQAPSVRLSTAELASKAGIYRIQAVPSVLASRCAAYGGLYQVTFSNAALYLMGGDLEQPRRLIPQDLTHFVVEDEGDLDALSRVEFVANYSRSVDAIVIREGSQCVVEAQRIAAS